MVSFWMIIIIIIIIIIRKGEKIKSRKMVYFARDTIVSNYT